MIIRKYQRPPALPLYVAAFLLAGTVLLAGCSERQTPEPRKGSATSAAMLLIARGKIELPGGVLPITASVSGTLKSLPVSEGAHVAAGDILATIDPTIAEYELKQSESQVQRAESVLHAATQAQAEAQRRAQRYARAAADGASDKQAADAAQAQYQQRLSDQMIARFDLDMTRAARDLQRHRLAQYTLRAPQAGTVVWLDATVGRLAGPQARPLMVLLPDVPAQVRAEVNESLADRVHEGMQATVVAEGAPVETGVPAQVRHVGQMFAASRLDDGHPVRRNLRVVETLLTLDPDVAFRVGQNVSVIFHE